ncbi:AFL039Cp [Eremothecium gossypii ATCC 10895]|uniref:Glutathione peroxidase n=1 Tax=Eremothecium gossypii (strain ATCC 10895 / CBS 109.51 / FGSC 9923 / NRRL Y-1056) TaxID=284811 RepID=Q754Y9_EREGS|nr:AFL039Cp [Eremothecium gossypii ATCC 10895]AAS53333.1 AFL039Cp [Eremothecium gossypii ATCC 10895]AEY97644.1 FAFL039Cp [Eremothecium gossypii FDAG1]
MIRIGSRLTPSLRHYTSSSQRITKFTMSGFYDLSPLDAKGEPFPFSQLKGKVVIIVNVASKCGFTPQYEELEELYKKYKDQGFEVIGFPCNQFAHQEPATNEEIVQFCKLNYGVTFPVLKKVDVNGADADPVYVYLKSQKSGLLGFKGIKWNFEKFLVDRKGQVKDRYSSITKPLSLEKTIETLLKEEGGPAPTATTEATATATADAAKPSGESL